MSEGHTLMLFLTTYKVVTILTGLAFAVMGYKLFIHGIFAEAGELRTNWDNKSLVLRKAAPGTFFACLGTIIVCVSLWRGLTLEPSQQLGGRGSGMFGSSTSQADDYHWRGPEDGTSRQTVLDDIALLNAFESDLLIQRGQGGVSQLTVVVNDSEQVLDMIDRTKTTLMLCAWSPDWGDREEFSNWARQAPGYSYGDPPTVIAQAAAIFKGDAE